MALAFGSTILAWVVLCAVALFADQQFNSQNNSPYSTNLQGVNALADQLKNDRQLLHPYWSEYCPGDVSSAAERAQAKKWPARLDALEARLNKFAKILAQGKLGFARMFVSAQLLMLLTADARSLYALRDSEMAAGQARALAKCPGGALADPADRGDLRGRDCRRPGGGDPARPGDRPGASRQRYPPSPPR